MSIRETMENLIFNTLLALTLYTDTALSSDVSRSAKSPYLASAVAPINQEIDNEVSRNLHLISGPNDLERNGNVVTRKLHDSDGKFKSTLEHSNNHAVYGKVVKCSKDMTNRTAASQHKTFGEISKHQKSLPPGRKPSDSFSRLVQEIGYEKRIKNYHSKLRTISSSDEDKTNEAKTSLTFNMAKYLPETATKKYPRRSWPKRSQKIQNRMKTNSNSKKIPNSTEYSFITKWTKGVAISASRQPSTLHLPAVTTLYLGLVIVSVSANTLVCSVVYRTQRLRTVTNLLLANLALSDLFMTLFNIPFSVMRVVFDDWPFGAVMCSLVPLVQATSVYVSSFTMVVIAADRYRMIVHSSHKRLSSTGSLLAIAVIWTVAVLLALPHAVFNRVVEQFTYRTMHRCQVIYPEPALAYRRGLTVATLVTQLGLPLAVTLGLYLPIMREVWGSVPLVGVSSTQQATMRVRNKKKTIKLLLAVVFCFMVSWTPLNAYHVVMDFTSPGTRPSSVVFFCCHWFAMTSVCYNPFLYFCLNQSFRVGFESFFKCGSKQLQRCMRFFTRNGDMCSCTTNDCSCMNQISSCSDGSRRQMVINESSTANQHKNTSSRSTKYVGCSSTSSEIVHAPRFLQNCMGQRRPRTNSTRQPENPSFRLSRCENHHRSAGTISLMSMELMSRSSASLSSSMQCKPSNRLLVSHKSCLGEHLSVPTHDKQWGSTTSYFKLFKTRNKLQNKTYQNSYASTFERDTNETRHRQEVDNGPSSYERKGSTVDRMSTPDKEVYSQFSFVTPRRHSAPVSSKSTYRSIMRFYPRSRRSKFLAKMRRQRSLRNKLGKKFISNSDPLLWGKAAV